jgi:hypothetical protein
VAPFRTPFYGLTPELSSFREGPGPSAKDESLQRVSSVYSATEQSGMHLGSIRVFPFHKY